MSASDDDSKGGARRTWLAPVALLGVLLAAGAVVYLRFAPDSGGDGRGLEVPIPGYERDETGAEVGAFDPGEIARFWVACGLTPPTLQFPRIEKAQCEAFHEALVELAREPSAEHFGLFGLFPLFWGLNEVAAPCFERAHALDPRDHRWAHYIAYASHHPGETKSTPDLARAEEYYRKSIGLEPNYIGSYLQLALVLTEQDRVDEAVQLFRKSLELDPTPSFAYGELGNIEFRRGNLEAALELCLEAVGRDDEDERAHILLSQIYAAQGNEERSHFHALKGHKGAQLSDPVPDMLILEMRRKTRALALLQPLGEYYFRIKEYRKLVEVAEELAARDPRAERMIQLVDAYRHNQQYDDARRTAVRALERFPDRPEAHVTFATLELACGNWRAATEKADDALARDSQLVEAYVVKARALGEMAKRGDTARNLAKSLEVIDQALELDPSNGATQRWRAKLLFNAAELQSQVARKPQEHKVAYGLLMSSYAAYREAARLCAATPQYASEVRELELVIRDYVGRLRGLGITLPDPGTASPPANPAAPQDK